MTSKDIPTAYVAEGALTDLQDVEGQVLLGPVGKDGQITKAMFGQPVDAGAVKPSEGKVALAVGVELSPGVARYLTPGSSVDVFVTYQTTSAAGAKSASAGQSTQRTKLFVSNVKVLSVSVATLPESSQDSTTSTSSATQVIAVLDLTPADAEKVVNASTLGSIYFALSSVDGSGQQHKTPQGVTPDDVVVSNR